MKIEIKNLKIEMDEDQFLATCDLVIDGKSFHQYGVDELKHVAVAMMFYSIAETCEEYFMDCDDLRRQVKSMNKTLRPLKFKSFNDYFKHYYPQTWEDLREKEAFEKGAEEYGKYLARKIFEKLNTQEDIPVLFADVINESFWDIV